MTVIVFIALIWKVIDFLRLLTNISTQKSAVLTQLTAWGGAIVLVALGAHAAVSANLVLPGSDLPLAQLGWTSVLLLGILIGSTASGVVDIKQAVDHTDSATKPPLLKSAAVSSQEPPAA